MNTNKKTTRMAGFLLDQEMKSIAQEFYRNNTDQLVAHGRFLDEKFERSETLFGIGSGCL